MGSDSSNNGSGAGIFEVLGIGGFVLLILIEAWKNL